MSDKKQKNKSEDAVKEGKKATKSKESVTKDIKDIKESKKGEKKDKVPASSAAKKDEKEKKLAAFSAKKDGTEKKKDTDLHKSKNVKKFKSAPLLKKNPIINILDQHRQHKLRIAKIIALISIAFIAIFFLKLAYEDHSKDKETNKKVGEIEKKLDLFKVKIDKDKGFTRNQAVVQAIILTYKGERVDWENLKKWQAKRKQLFETFDSKRPKFSENFVVPTVAIEMMAIPQGEFMMGRKINEAKGCTNELPRRMVKIDYPFWIGKTEVTNYQYRVLYPQHTEKKYDGYALNLITQPVVQVSWHHAQQYCKMLTFHEQQKERIASGYVYRLPTEAEWEYACRASTDTSFYWGDKFEETGKEYANILDQLSAEFEKVTIFKDSPKRDGHYVTAPVSSFKPNAFGLYDVSGNVWEWCWDWYNPGAYRKQPSLNPVQTSPVVSEIIERGNFDRTHKIESTSKVIRGGGCLSPPLDCRSAKRDFVVPEKQNNGIGFRIVLAPPIEMLEIRDEN